MTKSMDSDFPQDPSFSVPHSFEDSFGRKLTPKEKYFYVMLRKFSDRFQSEGGWFFVLDRFEKSKGNDGGFCPSFDQCGFSARTCKTARKKLKAAGLIECRYVHGAKGYRIGTKYRLLDANLARSAKAAHQAIMGKLGGPTGNPGGKNGHRQGLSEGSGNVRKSAGYGEPFAASLVS